MEVQKNTYNKALSKKRVRLFLTGSQQQIT